MHHNTSMLIKVSTLSICLQLICSTNFFTKALKSKLKKKQKQTTNHVVSISLFVEV